MQIAIDITNTELISLRIKLQLSDFGRWSLFSLFKRRESIRGSPVPELDDAFIRAAEIVGQSWMRAETARLFDAALEKDTHREVVSSHELRLLVAYVERHLIAANSASLWR